MPANTNISHLDRLETIKYNISGKGDNIDVKNITQFIALKKEIQRDIAFYTYYEMLPGERPDTVSQKLYDTPEFYWTFFLLNDHLKSGLNNWYLTDNQLEKYLAKEYDPYFWVSGTVGGHANNSIFSQSRSQELYQIPLDEKYLPHLSITFEKFPTGFSSAEYTPVAYDHTSLKIKYYDHSRVGLIVHKPSSLQYITAELTGPGDETQLLLSPDEGISEFSLDLIGGSGGKAPFEDYAGGVITQASNKTDDYIDRLNNSNNIVFSAGRWAIGKRGNNITLKVVEFKDAWSYEPGIIKKPIISKTETGRDLITFYCSPKTTIAQFVNFINALQFDQNYKHENSTWEFWEEELTTPIARLAITHDQSYLGWEWQRECAKLRLKGWNSSGEGIINPGPYIDPVPIGVDERCATIFDNFTSFDNQRSAVYFNSHMFFSTSELRNAIHSMYETVQWSPALPAPGAYNNLSEEEKAQFEDDLILEKSPLDFSEIILRETLSPTYNLPETKTYEELETEKNESHRKLRVARPEMVIELSQKYSELLNLNAPIN